MGDRSDRPSPAAPLAYLAPVCAGLLVISVWYRHFRRSQLNSRFLDLESIPFRRGPSVISTSDVDKQFPLVRYSDWWADRSRRESVIKETAGSLRSISNDSNRHEDKEKENTVPDEQSMRTGPAEDAPCITDNAHESVHDVGAVGEHEGDAVANTNESGFLCAICMDSFEDEIYIRPLTCGHIFHSACVDPWLTRRRASCPLCNKSFCENEETGERERTIAQPLTLLPIPRTALIRGDVFPRTI
ncbi:hypothetical protein BDV28DRAFT_157473 [Aspergillus coremiiformis]|uniref:RING-type E3 ubiquitin transferase n=1 Tax=Aspergillus coremiiformis TaxID=138285 RepID=A0A5N6Z5G7_9EURO|nr:hypothetical protein BDV28DRAFT_157473 [Aspergillus coremiiformis]